MNFRDNELLDGAKVEFSDMDYLAEGGEEDAQSDFDVLLVGDMYFDDDLGGRVARVTNELVTNSENDAVPKTAGVGDGGRGGRLRGRRRAHLCRRHRALERKVNMN